MNSETLERLELLRKNISRLSDDTENQADLDLLIMAKRDYRTALDLALPDLISAAKENADLKTELVALEAGYKQALKAGLNYKAELEAVKTKSDLNINAMRYLEQLTPGGSEFYGDPERCFNYAMSKRKSMMEIAKKAVIRANMLQAELEVVKANRDVWAAAVSKAHDLLSATEPVDSEEFYSRPLFKALEFLERALADTVGEEST